MNVALCTLCLNESEFLARSYQQHKDWPGLVCWSFVHAADPEYAKASPDLVDEGGLSVDGTGDILDALKRQDPRVQVNHYGWMIDVDKKQHKTKGRDRYLDELEKVAAVVPGGLDFFVVLDADEFYTREHQKAINEMVSLSDRENTLCWRLPQRHIWRPPCLIGLNTFNFEVRGGYWSVPHVRIFRWRTGLRYRRDHNWPETRHYHPLRHRYNGEINRDPQCIHLGFARASRERIATNRYYQFRGEGFGDGRGNYVSCRGAWERWKPGRVLPSGARVVKYDGPIPECFREDQ